MSNVDDREHFLHCSKTQHLWDIADAENTFTPAEQRLYQRMHISPEQLLKFRRTISNTIRLNAFTRIGVFNQSQHDHILQSLGAAYVDESVGYEIRREIEQRLTPWIRAMTIAVKLRNSTKYSSNQKEETKETRETLVDCNCVVIVFVQLKYTRKNFKRTWVPMQVVQESVDVICLCWCGTNFLYVAVRMNACLTWRLQSTL